MHLSVKISYSLGQGVCLHSHSSANQLQKFPETEIEPFRVHRPRPIQWSGPTGTFGIEVLEQD